MAKEKKQTSSSKPAKKSPRPQRLPGMEDAKIAELENKALDYADIRDERIKLSVQEGDLKKELLTLMKARKLEHYAHGSVTIDIVHESENVKVKVKAQSTEELSHEEAEDSATTVN